jgi:Ca2+-binding EF-hand superfamily protein
MGAKGNASLSNEERKKLKRTFSFLDKAYKNGLTGTRLSSDYAHFYIMSTTLLEQGIFPVDLDKDGRAELTRKLIEFGKHMVVQPPPKDDTDMGKYLLLSSKQTTDAKKRVDRQKLFKEILGTL